MPKRKEIRTFAMQVLYQLDVRGEGDREDILAGMKEAPGTAQEHQEGYELALAAWEARGKADTLATELAPDWPTHRQPPVDRAILRLAFHEMASGYAPVKVAINEAVELAKRFGAEQSAAFANGVLDKMARRIEAGEPILPADVSPAAEGTDSAAPSAATAEPMLVQVPAHPAGAEGVKG
ncbi:MAG: transcription antitermination factor NusB [Phycisphaeraceae bacterium]|nr:transcription antitermination factor NusB [Phycisphaeraceae bacterium]